MKRRAAYASNKDLLREIAQSKIDGRPTRELCRLMLAICDGVGRKGNFAGYSYIEEMKGEAIIQLYDKWAKFNPDKSQNPFAYFTIITHNAFLRVLKAEKKQQEIRDDLLEDAGMHGSSTRQVRNDLAY